MIGIAGVGNSGKSSRCRTITGADGPPWMRLAVRGVGIVLGLLHGAMAGAQQPAGYPAAPQGTTVLAPSAAPDSNTSAGAMPPAQTPASPAFPTVAKTSFGASVPAASTATAGSAVVGSGGSAVSMSQPAPGRGHGSVRSPEAAAVSQSLQQAAVALRDAARQLQAAAARPRGATRDAGPGPPSAADVARLSARGWNGAFVRVSEQGASASVAFTVPLFGGHTRLSGSLAAPLNKALRTAALTSRGRPLPFQLTLGVEFDSLQSELLDMLDGLSGRLALCRRYRAGLGSDAECGGEKFESYLNHVREQRRQGLAPGASDGLRALTVPRGVRATYGLQLQAGLDRSEVYRDDLASPAVHRTSLHVSMAAMGRFYPAAWLAIPLQLGAQLDRRLEAEKITRCSTLASTDATISGSDCRPALWLASDVTTAMSAFAEVAAVVTWPNAAGAGLSPGLELRERVEGLGSLPLNRLSSAIFVTPTDGAVVTRFGLGVEHVARLASGGPSWVDFYLLVGAGL